MFLIVQPLLGKKYIKFNLTQTIIYLLMVFFVLRNNPSIKSLSAVVVLYTVAMLTLVVTASYQGEEWIDYFFKICKVWYMFYALYTIIEKFSVYLFLFSVMLFPSGADTLYSQYNSGCMPGLTNHYSTNGMLLGAGIIIFGSELIYRKRKKDILLFAIMLIALLLTGKRSDIIFTVGGLYLAYYCFMSNKKKTRLTNTITIIIFVSLALFIVINFIPSLATFINRFESTAESGDVTLGRTKMWAVAMDCFLENPVLGIGWGRFKYRNLKEWNAHNIYVQLLAETGIVGFLVYIFFFISTLVKSWQYLKAIRIKGNAKEKEELYLIFSIAMQVFFLLYGFTGNPLYDKEVYVPYYIACTITYYFTKKSTNKRLGDRK